MEEAIIDENVLPKELSDLSFAELFELKDKIGEKAYDQLIFGKEPPKQKKEFHRENKNRPREMSSKIEPTFLNYHKNVCQRETKSVDPRFSQTYGDFYQHEFEKNYKFINNLKKKEKKVLLKQLENPETDDLERDKIKSLLQRMENQKKEQARKKKQDNLENISREYQIDELKEGRKPQFYKKSEKKLFSLVQHFEELKQKGGLIKHIKRRRKKLTQKDRKKMKSLN